MGQEAITREAVLKAVAEHDEMGREAFLSMYGFGEARSYVLVHEGREYDSKAIAGVAHKWDQGRALKPGEFSGGKDHAAAWLKRLGFQVKAVKNPDWVRDEVILACQLVMVNGWKRLFAEDPRVTALSELLQRVPIHPEADRGEKFRSPDSVARKTVDIASRHPDYVGKATNGGALDRAVLREFLDHSERMDKTAVLLRQGLEAGSLQELVLAEEEEIDDDFSAPEGRLLYRRHRARERSRALRRKKIDSVVGRGMSLACEACDFDYEEVYGERGKDYIEVHHVVPLHEAGEGITRLADLALICASCHRMIHRRAPWPTPAQLKEIVQTRRLARGTANGHA
ncbi:HNH endonuclease [Streptomyces sp. NPDC057939]|uniref:HNH endonuclease n=1 Tax=Streptomyces sp. NPDC057939 TaxID=3346284 RepID=UPI0036DFF581